MYKKILFGAVLGCLVQASLECATLKVAYNGIRNVDTEILKSVVDDIYMRIGDPEENFIESEVGNINLYNQESKGDFYELKLEDQKAKINDIEYKAQNGENLYKSYASVPSICRLMMQLMVVNPDNVKDNFAEALIGQKIGCVYAALVAWILSKNNLSPKWINDREAKKHIRDLLKTDFSDYAFWKEIDEESLIHDLNIYLYGAYFRFARIFKTHSLNWVKNARTRYYQRMQYTLASCCGGIVYNKYCEVYNVYPYICRNSEDFEKSFADYMSNFDINAFVQEVVFIDDGYICVDINHFIENDLKKDIIKYMDSRADLFEVELSKLKDDNKFGFCYLLENCNRVQKSFRNALDEKIEKDLGLPSSAKEYTSNEGCSRLKEFHLSIHRENGKVTDKAWNAIKNCLNQLGWSGFWATRNFVAFLVLGGVAKLDEKGEIFEYKSYEGLWRCNFKYPVIFKKFKKDIDELYNRLISDNQNSIENIIKKKYGLGVTERWKDRIKAKLGNNATQEDIDKEFFYDLIRGIKLEIDAGRTVQTIFRNITLDELLFLACLDCDLAYGDKFEVVEDIKEEIDYSNQMFLREIKRRVEECLGELNLEKQVEFFRNKLKLKTIGDMVKLLQQLKESRPENRHNILYLNTIMDYINCVEYIEDNVLKSKDLKFAEIFYKVVTGDGKYGDCSYNTQQYIRYLNKNIDEAKETELGRKIWENTEDFK